MMSASFTSRWPRKKGIVLKVEADTPAPVKGNRELVSQAVANLVDNAIKYGDAHRGEANGAKPEIVVRALSEGDRILLTVADRGPGIRGSRPRARGRALRAAGAKPLAAGPGPGFEPCLGGGAAAWRRVDA